MSISMALDAIRDERKRQDEKWGVQNHGDLAWLAVLAEEFGEAAIAVTKASVPPCYSRPTEEQEQALRKELIQTAAVCVAWIQCLNRRRAFGAEAQP